MAMEELKQMKTLLTSQVQAQLANIEKVNAQELGAAIDMIKDLSMTMYYCSVVDAMEKAEKESKENGSSNGNNTVYYTERYYPMYADSARYMGDSGRYYNESRYYNRDRDNDGRYNESSRRYAGEQGNNSRYHDYPYYDYMEPVARDLREGRSPRARRLYMESKEQHQEKEVKLKELEKYMGELSQDITEMIADATPEEKTMLHKKLSALTNKIELLNK